MSAGAARVATFAAAAAAAAAAFLALPRSSGDPLRATLVLVPLVVASLVEIGRWAAARGGRRTPAPVRAAEALLLAVFIFAGLAGPRLGLPLLDRLAIAGLALLLAHRLARLLLALRPSLGTRLDSPPPAVFFFLPLVAYLALAPWQTAQRQPDGDEPYYLLVTHSLAYDFDAELSNNYQRGDWRHFMERPIGPQPGDPKGPHGEVYSRHNELLPLVLAPAYRLAGRAGVVVVMALLTAALAWLTLALARHYVPERPGEALLAYALTAFAPPLLLYSHQVWAEVPAALLALYALDRLRSPGTAPSARGWLRLGVPLLLLPLLKMRFALLAAPLLALAWWRGGLPRRALVALTVLLAVVSGGVLLHNQLLYGNPLKIHTWQELELRDDAPRDYALGALGLFYDAAFGLFSCAPIWMIAVPALALLAARRHPLLLDLGVLAAPYLAVVAPRREWYGGWSPPFRYALFALPLLALALVPLLARRRQSGARALLAGLGALTLVLALLWLAVPGWTYNLAHGRTHLLDALSEGWRADVARFFPSAVRPRFATWLWPLASVPLLCLLWWWPRRRPRRAAAWGVALLLAAAAALPLAARGLPTRLVEFEDPQVRKQGGRLFPDLWVIERPRHRGGWVLRAGESVAAPVVAGGRRARVRVDLEFVRRGRGVVTLELYAGAEPRGAVRLRAPRTWASAEFGPVDWPPGEPLVLALPGPRAAGDRNAVILDRAVVDWE